MCLLPSYCFHEFPLLPAMARKLPPSRFLHIFSILFREPLPISFVKVYNSSNRTDLKIAISDIENREFGTPGKASSHHDGTEAKGIAAERRYRRTAIRQPARFHEDSARPPSRYQRLPPKARCAPLTSGFHPPPPRSTISRRISPVAANGSGTGAPLPHPEVASGPDVPVISLFLHPR